MLVNKRQILNLVKVLFLFIVLHGVALLAETYTIRYATLAPDGSIWAKYAKKIKKEVETKSGGRIEMKIYFGGVAGDEKTVIQKMKHGLIDMSSLSGIGLGEILPMSRIFELPFFFETYGQIDHVTHKLYSEMSSAFDGKGFVLAGWGEGGFVYLMSKKPIRTAKDMHGLKIWAPAGDVLVKTMLSEYGLVPVYLGFGSVLPQLQTDGLDAVYAPPTAAIGLQWFREVSYISDLRLTCATGATLISKSAYSKLPSDLKKILKNASEKYSRELVLALRADNDSAKNILLAKGIKKINVDPSEATRLRSTALKVQEQLAGSLYSEDLLERARKLRQEAR